MGLPVPAVGGGGWGGQPCWSEPWKTTTETCLTWSPDAHVLLAIHDKASHWLSVGVVRCSLADYKSTQHSFLVTGGGRKRVEEWGQEGRGEDQRTRRTYKTDTIFKPQFIMSFRPVLCASWSLEFQVLSVFKEQHRRTDVRLGFCLVVS